MRSRESGAALIDVLCTTALMAIVAGITVPTIQAAREHYEARAAARFVAARFQAARLEALKRNVLVAFRFDPVDPNQFRLFADGDGDGVLEADITQGVDYPIGEGERLSDYTRTIAFRINQEVPERD